MLSTRHTNTAIGAVTRLKRYGYLTVNSKLIDWRGGECLVRTLCSHCATWHDADEFEQSLFANIEHADRFKRRSPKAVNSVHTLDLWGAQQFMKLYRLMSTRVV